MIRPTFLVTGATGKTGGAVVLDRIDREQLQPVPPGPAFLDRRRAPARRPCPAIRASAGRGSSRMGRVPVKGNALGRAGHPHVHSRRDVALRQLDRPGQPAGRPVERRGRAGRGGVPGAEVGQAGAGEVDARAVGVAEVGVDDQAMGHPAHGPFQAVRHARRRGIRRQADLGPGRGQGGGEDQATGRRRRSPGRRGRAWSR